VTDRVFDWGALLTEGPLFIGILNLTPDSFSDGGRFMDPAQALAQARKLLGLGCRMLDLGAESTRPGAAPVAPNEEWSRLAPALAVLRRELPDVPLSLDTRHAGVAEQGLQAGISVLNDVTGFADPAMLALAASATCGLIAMRSRQRDGALYMPDYASGGPVPADGTLAELRALKTRLLDAGAAPQRLLLDPGFGFGTTFAEDAALWSALPQASESIPWPLDRLCMGISRKRFLAHRAGTPALPPMERDGLTAAAHAEAAAWGCQVFRTHAATLGS
jgi:dihydropteroate synthase